MIRFLKEKLINEGLWVIIAEIFICYRMVSNLIYSTESPYQTPKDLYFFYAVIWFMVLIILLRGKELVRKDVCFTFVLGVIAVAVFFAINNITPFTYGVDYFQIVLFNPLMVVAFIAMLIAFVRADSAKEILKRNRIILIGVLILGIFIAIYNKSDVIAIVCPIICFLLTKITKERWMRLLNSFAAGYYMSFAKTMTQSLIQNPDRYQGGRYLGSFMELESGGMFCGGAVVCMLYFIAIYVLSEKKRWYMFVIPMVLMVYPIYAVLRISSRSTQLSLLLVFFLFFVFIHKGGDRKVITKRLALVLGACVVLMVAVFAYSVHLNELVDSGEKEELSYWESHIKAITSESGRKGNFEDGSILNPLDKLSSGRLYVWALSIQQIRLTGNKFAVFYFNENSNPVSTPHNFFILWLVEYGLIGGVYILICFIVFACVCLKKMATKELQIVFPFLWFGFCTGIFTFSCIRWKSPISYALLIMLYGLSKFETDKDMIEDKSAT